MESRDHKHLCSIPPLPYTSHLGRTSSLHYSLCSSNIVARSHVCDDVIMSGKQRAKCAQMAFDNSAMKNYIIWGCSFEYINV